MTETIIQVDTNSPPDDPSFGPETLNNKLMLCNEICIQYAINNLNRSFVWDVIPYPDIFVVFNLCN